MELETERLLLREFKASDWKDVHEYAKDAQVARFMEWGPNTSDETIAFVDKALDLQREKPRRIYDMAVIYKAEKKLIGAAGIRIIPADLRQADIGYCYNQKYWSRGLASEACRALVDFGFKDLGLHRIYATCDADNLGSAKVMQNSGMRKEAHFVQDKEIKGRWRDTLLYAILRSEWEARRAKD